MKRMDISLPMHDYNSIESSFKGPYKVCLLYLDITLKLFNMPYHRRGKVSKQLVCSEILREKIRGHISINESISLFTFQGFKIKDCWSVHADGANSTTSRLLTEYLNVVLVLIGRNNLRACGWYNFNLLLKTLDSITIQLIVLDRRQNFKGRKGIYGVLTSLPCFPRGTSIGGAST